jgi:glycosyltransferase involved in cell wall biosynthesis
LLSEWRGGVLVNRTFTREQATTERGGVPRILAITTTFRPSEVTGPMAHVPDGSTLVLGTSGNPLVRGVRTAVRTYRAIHDHQPDVVLVDALGTIGFTVSLVCRLTGTPVVVRLVGDPWRSSFENFPRRDAGPGDLLGALLRFGYARLNRTLLSMARGYLTVSTELAEVARRATGCPPERIGVVPVPYRAMPAGDGEAARRRFGIESGTVLLTVTNLRFRHKYRGVVDTLADLVPVLEEQYVVAGGGASLSDLRGHVDRAYGDSPARDRINVLGYVDEVFDCYDLADIFVYVSYVDGYPNAVLEAQTAGLPVVANDAHGMADQIQDGETGLLVDPSRSGAIAEAVERLLDSPAERERLGTAARERVARENAPERVGQRLGTVLARILAADR